MTNDIENELSRIRTRTAEAQDRKTRASVKLESVEEQLEAKQAELKKFKVSSVEEAETLISKIEKQMIDKIEAAKAALSEVTSD